MRCARKAATLPNLRLEVWEKLKQYDENMIENGVGNPSKFELQGWFGAPGRPSWRQDGPRCDLGRVWDSIWRSVGAHLGAKMGQVRLKMALSCPTWRQDVPKMSNLEPKMANLEHFWEHLGDFCCILARYCPKLRRPKNLESTALFKVF